jgi:cytidylate kinase
MYLLKNTFLWQGAEVLKHQLLIDEDFIKKNKIERVSASELILIFEYFYGIDIGDYGLNDVLINQENSTLTIHLKDIDDFRVLQLRKLIS